MTYKYYEVRRQIYENCSDKPLKKYRIFSNMKKLFKWTYWAITILMLVCLAASVVLVFKYPTKLYYFIPAIIMLLLNILVELFSEKLYNPLERKQELSERSQCYNEYIQNIKDTLIECGLSSKSYWKALKTECESNLSLRNKGYGAAGNKVFDMLIGVPLGALISSLIYRNGEAIVVEIITLIVIGLMLMALLKVAKKTSYYSDGYFKDQHLLNVLKELEYVIDD